MDKILMRNLSFFGYHGVLPEENKLGQKYNIDVTLHVDLIDACRSDEVLDTVNYAEVFEIVQYHTTLKQYKLIEALAQSIINEIFQKHKRVQEIEILVKKPEAPVNGIFDYFGVELRRSRNA